MSKPGSHVVSFNNLTEKAQIVPFLRALHAQRQNFITWASLLYYKTLAKACVLLKIEKKKSYFKQDFK